MRCICTGPRDRNCGYLGMPWEIRNLVLRCAAIANPPAVSRLLRESAFHQALELALRLLRPRSGRR
jgi:hypothetical protein